MLTKIELIATIQNTAEIYTLYFFHKKDKIILPVKIKDCNAQKLTEANDDYKNAVPTIYDTFKRLLGSLEIKLTGIAIYRFEQDIYYTYLNINADGNALEINSGFLDSLILSKKLVVPILIDKTLLYNQGIKVTNKLLKEALGQDYQAL